jgi:hypothetical protein
MTTYRHPDYSVALVIELGEFRQVSGTSLNVSVAFGGQRERVGAMLIIPEGNEFPDLSKTCEAWLWSDAYTDMDIGTEVAIQIIGTSDPMLMTQKHEELLPHLGSHLKGKITRNWNAEPRTAADADTNELGS